jgi:sterol desaturase/sphingolipid hydroxylase (fatty acid hydroxylase superfamily)
MKDEPAIRLIAALAILIAMALWEAAAPRRPRMHARGARWPANLGVALIDAAIVRVIVPGGAVGFAIFCAAHRWGFFNVFAPPAWLAIVLTVVALDFIIYLQHVMFHAVPALWRIHRMHHSDLDFDVTTGVRFHPIEIALSMGIKLFSVAALGTPAAGVLAFEVLLNATSTFNHANANISPARDAILRLFVVTPDMHRVHHSVVVRETNSNFGFNLPWWDRLLGTYRAAPEASHLGMTIGIAELHDARELGMLRMLVQPWRGSPGEYPING